MTAELLFLFFQTSTATTFNLIRYCSTFHAFFFFVYVSCFVLLFSLVKSRKTFVFAADVLLVWRGYTHRRRNK